MQASMERQDRLALVILAVIQSALLLLLHKAIEHETWPSTDMRWMLGLYTLCGGLPAFFYLAGERLHDRWNAIAGGLLGIVLFLIGWHGGWLLGDYADVPRHMNGFQVISPLFLTVAIGLFVLALYFRSWRQAPDQPLAYARLIENSWLNALTVAFLGLFLLVFWLLLVLWGQLFEVIGIAFFEELFEKIEFIYPVTGLVGGLGLVIIRNRIAFIATVRRLCETLTRALLPLVAVIGLLFLLVLPFTGIGKLWEDGPGSPLLVSLLALTLFFFNAELGDDDGGYPPALRWLVLAAIVVLPVHSLLASWGLYLRVDQYGWTVARLWAVFIELFLAAWAFGYALFIVMQRGLPLARIRQWNIYLGLALGVMLLVVQGPVIDFRRISANDQADRLLEGTTSIEDFDARYLRFELGSYGVEKLEELKASEEFADNEKAQEILTDALEAKSQWSGRTSRLDATELRFAQPAGTDKVPAEVIEAFAKQQEWYASNCRLDEARCTAIPIEFKDRRLWLLVNHAPGTQTFQSIFDERKCGWGEIGSVDSERIIGVSDDDPTTAVKRLDDELLAFEHNGRIYLIEPYISYLQEIGVLPKD